VQTAAPWLRRLWLARDRLHLALLDRAKLLPRLNLTFQVRVGERRFRVPVTQGIRLHPDLEPWLDLLLRKVLTARPGGFVDVGANLGQTLLKVKALFPAVDYSGFEPNPRCYCYVKDLIALNELPACRIYPFALGEAPAVVELFQSSDVDQAASVVEGFRSADHYSSRQFATVFPGDQVLRDGGMNDVSTIKIDVEGAERDVLLGLTSTIDRDRPFIICEVLPVYDASSDIGQFRLSRQREIEAFLRQRNYSIQRVGEDAKLTRVEEFGVHGDLTACNYLFSPIERGALAAS
jgi:FkbM family methyltransferase